MLCTGVTIREQRSCVQCAACRGTFWSSYDKARDGVFARVWDAITQLWVRMRAIRKVHQVIPAMPKTGRNRPATQSSVVSLQRDLECHAAFRLSATSSCLMRGPAWQHTCCSMLMRAGVRTTSQR